MRVRMAENYKQRQTRQHSDKERKARAMMAKRLEQQHIWQQESDKEETGRMAEIHQKCQAKQQADKKITTRPRMANNSQELLDEETSMEVSHHSVLSSQQYGQIQSENLADEILNLKL